MAWPTWQQAAVLMLVMLVGAWAGRRQGGVPARILSPAALEVALISFLYMLWRLARVLPLTHDQGAEDRGRWIYDAQRRLHLPSELTMERIALHHPWLARVTVDYYATLHVPALLAFLVWLYVRHRDQYPHWRNALAITTGCCLFIRFLRVAPPRLLPEYGFIDLPARLGVDIYGPVGTGASDQFAAMPSIHVAWAALVGLGVWSVSTSRWRWIGPFHLVATFWAVMATANHWWFDGLAAVALLGIALAVDDRARRLLGDRGAVGARDRAGVEAEGAGEAAVEPVGVDGDLVGPAPG